MSERKQEIAVNAGMCRLCAGRIYVGDAIQSWEVSGVMTASHQHCVDENMRCGSAPPAPPSPSQPVAVERDAHRVWQKRPVNIKAVLWDGTNTDEVLDFISTKGEARRGDDNSLLISTLEGDMRASKGDWIIEGVNGEFYPCKPDIFAETYQRPQSAQPVAAPTPEGVAWQSIESIQKLLSLASDGVWDFTVFAKPNGDEIQTVDDVIETTSYSARQSEKAELWGVSLQEKAPDGMAVIVCYTGNGPHSKNNAQFLANAKDALKWLLAEYIKSLDYTASLEARLADSERQAKHFDELQARYSGEWHKEIAVRLKWQARADALAATLREVEQTLNRRKHRYYGMTSQEVMALLSRIRTNTNSPKENTKE